MNNDVSREKGMIGEGKETSSPHRKEPQQRGRACWGEGTAKMGGEEFTREKKVPSQFLI